MFLLVKRQGTGRPSWGPTKRAKRFEWGSKPDRVLQQPNSSVVMTFLEPLIMANNVFKLQTTFSRDSLYALK
jgi:hypothetical protein